MSGQLHAHAAFSPGKVSDVPAEEEAGCVQSRSGRSAAEKTSCPAGNRSTPLWSAARYTVTIPTELPLSLHSHTLKSL